jgi:methylated-DNA-protein-cysteine methyltransferase related protein
MAKSAAFARIKKEVLSIVEAIPSGKVSTYKAIGESLDVMPRHVAYILTTLGEDESEQIPWHRVVSEGGKITAPKLLDEQILRLSVENLICKNGKITDFENSFVSPNNL